MEKYVKNIKRLVILLLVSSSFMAYGEDLPSPNSLPNISGNVVAPVTPTVSTPMPSSLPNIGSSVPMTEAPVAPTVSTPTPSSLPNIGSSVPMTEAPVAPTVSTPTPSSLPNIGSSVPMTEAPVAPAVSTPTPASLPDVGSSVPTPEAPVAPAVSTPTPASLPDVGSSVATPEATVAPALPTSTPASLPDVGSSVPTPEAPVAPALPTSTPASLPDVGSSVPTPEATVAPALPTSTPSSLPNIGSSVPTPVVTETPAFLNSTPIALPVVIDTTESEVIITQEPEVINTQESEVIVSTETEVVNVSPEVDTTLSNDVLTGSDNTVVPSTPPQGIRPMIVTIPDNSQDQKAIDLSKKPEKEEYVVKDYQEYLAGTVDERPDYSNLERALVVNTGGTEVAADAYKFPIQIIATGGTSGTGFVYAQKLCILLNNVISFTLRSCTAIAVENPTAASGMLYGPGSASFLITRGDYWARSLNGEGPLGARKDLRVVSFLNYDAMIVFARKSSGINSINNINRVITSSRPLRVGILRPTDNPYLADFVEAAGISSTSVTVFNLSLNTFNARFCSKDADIDIIVTVGGLPDYIMDGVLTQCKKEIVPIGFSTTFIGNMQSINRYYESIRIPRSVYSLDSLSNIPIENAITGVFNTVGIRQVLVAPDKLDPILVYQAARSYLSIFADIRKSMPTRDMDNMSTEGMLVDDKYNFSNRYHDGIFNYMYIHNEFFGGLGYIDVTDFKFYGVMALINPAAPRVTFDGGMVFPTTTNSVIDSLGVVDDRQSIQNNIRN